MAAPIQITKYLYKNAISHHIKHYYGQSLCSKSMWYTAKHDAGILRHGNHNKQRYSTFSNIGIKYSLLSRYRPNIVPSCRLSKAEYTMDIKYKGYSACFRVLDSKQKHVGDTCQNVPLIHSSHHYSTDPGVALKKEIERITEQFMEAREMLDDLAESIGTVYFSDDLLEAEDAVKDTIKEYEDLLEKCGEEQRRQATQIMGLKMEELKGHLAMVYDQIKD